MARLGLETLTNRRVRTGSPNPGRKLLTVVAAMMAGATHIDHVEVLRAGATGRVLPFKVMAPSTVGTFLRSFTFGHIRQLDAVLSRVLTRAWSVGAGPGAEPLVIDLDSTICEVHGHTKEGAAYGYTKLLGYHPLLATRAGTGEVLSARMRKGSAGSSRGVVRFVDELVAMLKRAGATGAATVRAGSGFWSWKLIDRLDAHHITWSITGPATSRSWKRSQRSPRMHGKKSTTRSAAEPRSQKPPVSLAETPRNADVEPCVSWSAEPGSPNPLLGSSANSIFARSLPVELPTHDGW